MGLSFLFGLKDLAEDLVDRVVNLQDDVCELLCELEDRICLVASRTSLLMVFCRELLFVRCQ